MIEYIEGDATEPVGDGIKIIAHCCNNVGAWGSGFVLAISAKWPLARDEYKEWMFTSDRQKLLGKTQFVLVDDDIIVANIIGQNNIRVAFSGRVPLRLPALREGLETVRDRAVCVGASVHMPRIGCGLAGGSWDEVGPLIEEVFEGSGVRVVVYDYV